MKRSRIIRIDKPTRDVIGWHLQAVNQRVNAVINEYGEVSAETLQQAIKQLNELSSRIRFTGKNNQTK